MDNLYARNSGQAQRYIECLRPECPPYQARSPDLAPTDFSLFGSIKGKLCSCNCESGEDLLHAITEISIEIHQGVFRGVFEPGENRPKQAIKHEGSTTLIQRQNNHFFKIERENEKIRTFEPSIISIISMT
jgi:hypothetical protein